MGDTMDRGIGDTFQQETKHNRLTADRIFIDQESIPEQYKEYPGCAKTALPKLKASEQLSLDEILKRRKSIRLFSQSPVTLEHLSYLLWATSGISRVTAGYEFRNVPSAGALYPIETYLVINNVCGLNRGVYHYAIRKHYLELLKEGDFGDRIASAALGDTMCSDAAVVIIWTAIFMRTKWKYGQRAYRYIYLDAGHIGQNLALAATGLGLGSCPVGAFFDDEINRLLDVNGEQESVVYMSVVGVPS